MSFREGAIDGSRYVGQLVATFSASEPSDEDVGNLIELLERLLRNRKHQRCHDLAVRALVALRHDAVAEAARRLLEPIDKAIAQGEAGELLANLDHAPDERPEKLTLKWMDQYLVLDMIERLMDRDARDLCVRQTAGLLGLAYRTDAAQVVLDRWYWALSLRSDTLDVFYECLEPRQTNRVLRRVLESSMDELRDVIDSAAGIPAAVRHFFPFLTTVEDEDEDGRRRLTRFFSNAAASRDSLECIVTAVERWLHESGRRPFEVEDRRPIVKAIRNGVTLIWDHTRKVGRQLGPEQARAFLPRLRGIEAQLELRWPRILNAECLRDRFLHSEVVKANCGDHPVKDLRDTAKWLGDSDIELNLYVAPATYDIAALEERCDELVRQARGRPLSDFRQGKEVMGATIWKAVP